MAAQSMLNAWPTSGLVQSASVHSSPNRTWWTKVP
jgi:hypothetical protein